MKFHEKKIAKNYIFYFIFTDGRNDDWSKDVDMRVEYGIDFGKKHGFVKSGQTVICVTGWRQGAGASNTIRML